MVFVSGVQAETSMELADKAEKLNAEGKYTEALESVNEAIKLDPELFNLYYVQGDILHQLRRYDDEVLAYEKGLAFDPENADILTRKGLALKEGERYEEAVESLEKAVQLYKKQMKNCGIAAGTTN